MTESLVLIPLLILLNVALLYMHSAYDTRLSTMRTSRHEGWKFVLDGCDSEGPNTYTDGTDPSLVPLTGEFARAMQYARGRTMMRPLLPVLDIGVGQVTKSSRGAKEVGVFRALPTTSYTRVLCNEKQDSISNTDKRLTIHLLYGQLI